MKKFLAVLGGIVIGIAAISGVVCAVLYFKKKKEETCDDECCYIDDECCCDDVTDDFASEIKEEAEDLIDMADDIPSTDEEAAL